MIRFILSRMSKAVECSPQFCLLSCCIQLLSMSALHIVLPAEVRHVSQRRTIRPGDLEWDLSQRPQSYQVHNQRTYELKDRNIPLNIASCDWPSPHWLKVIPNISVCCYLCCSCTTEWKCTSDSCLWHCHTGKLGAHLTFIACKSQWCEIMAMIPPTALMQPPSSPPLPHPNPTTTIIC